VIWPGDRYFRILAGEGQASAITALQELLAERKNPQKCRAFADVIISKWKSIPSYSYRSDSKSPQMLKRLGEIADPELVMRFLQEVLPNDYAGTEGPILSELCVRLGWDHLAQPLTRFVSLQTPASRTASLAATVAIFSQLCCHAADMTPERKAACTSMALELKHLISKWDSHKEKNRWSGPPETREGIIETLTRALCAIDDTDFLERFLSHAFADPEHYGLHAILIPAVTKMHQWIDQEPGAIDYYEQLHGHCVEGLQALTARPVEEPKDWAQHVTLGCQCPDCKELEQFLRDPQERVHRFAVRKERRQHLHEQIDRHRCDVDHVTERRGSPQTLVCTKNRASYARQKQQFAANERLLAELRAIQRSAGKRAIRRSGQPK